MGTAFANASSAHALAASQHPPNLKQDGSEKSEEGEYSEKEEDEIDDYDRSLDGLLDNNMNPSNISYYKLHMNIIDLIVEHVRICSNKVSITKLILVQ